MYCTKCGNEIKDTDSFCSKCGTKSGVIEDTRIQQIQSAQKLPDEGMPLSVNKENPEKKIKCPNCKSIDVTTNKKGFSGTKAVAGAVLTGGIGILAGTIGSNKVVITCLSCGKRFNIGDDYESVKAKNSQTKQMVSSKGGKIFLGIFLLLISGGLYWLGLPYWFILIFVVGVLIKILWDANNAK